MKKIIIVINVVAILILVVFINYHGSITEYIFAWMLFLVPLIIFDVIVFCFPKIYKKLFGSMKKDSERISLSRKIIYAVVVIFSLGFIFATTLMITSFAGRLLSGPEKHEAPETTNSESCTRSEPYKIAPEFERGISIIKQKMTPDGFLDNFENCLDVEYDKLKEKNDGPEGVFMFDSSVSSPDDLKIFVDNSYQSEDDYMTAVLLVHEITHAKQFYEKQDISCVDKEVHAFWNEFVLLTKLNEGEKHAITARLYDPTKRSLSDPLRGIDNIIETVKVPFYGKCKQDMKCTQEESAKLLKKQIESSPYYKKQCEL